MKTMEEFVASLNDEQLICLFNTLDAFAGLTREEMIFKIIEISDCCEMLIDVRGLEVSE